MQIRAVMRERENIDSESCWVAPKTVFTVETFVRCRRVSLALSLVGRRRRSKADYLDARRTE